MKQFIKELFSELNSASVEYAILRNYENLPLKPADSDYFDLDLFVSRKSFAKYVVLVEEVCKRTGCQIIKRFDRGYVKHIRVVKLGKDAIASVQLDSHIFGQGWHGYYYATEDEIIKSRKLYDEFYVVSDFHKALFNWLDKLLWGGFVKEKYKNDILHVFDLEKEMLRLFLKRICSERVVSELIKIIESANLEETLAYRLILRRSIIRNSIKKYPLKTLFWNIRFYYCEAKLRLFPPGMLLLADNDSEAARSIFDSLRLVVLGDALYKKCSCDSRIKWWIFYIRNVYPIVRKQGLVFLVLDGDHLKLNCSTKINVLGSMIDLMENIVLAYKNNTVIGRANMFVSGL